MQFKETQSNKNKTFSIFMLLVSLIFYMFFAFYDGAVICVDSPSYIDMNISREPAYPIFLAFFRFIFSGLHNDFYLTAVIFIQSLLAAIAAWSFAAYTSKEFKLNKLFSLFVLFIPLFVSILCRFAAKRGSMYSNDILTEGIAISCYFLFFRFIIEFILHQSKKSFLYAWILTFLLISTRKQMFISLFLLVLSILIIFFKNNKHFKGIILSFLCVISILLSTTLLDLGYNYALRGEFIRHSSDTRFITTMAFYTAERNDSQYIDDKEIQNLFLEIYDICDQNGYLKSSAGKGWLNRVSHFGDNYDHIQIDTMWPLICQFSATHYGDDIVSMNEHADQIMNIINQSVIPHNLPKIICTFMDNILSGLITTVAQRNPVLIWYSLFIYLFYIALLAVHIFITENSKIILFASLTFVSIALNVGLVSMVIFCQTRYTIYNMALFYISLLLMIYDLLCRLRQDSKTAPHNFHR